MIDYNKHEWLNLWKKLFSYRFNDFFLMILLWNINDKKIIKQPLMILKKIKKN